jgi:hypothetical protein
VNFLRLPHEHWRDFFDGMTVVMRGRLVEIDVVGLDIGDLVQAEWLPLNGLTYEPRSDTLYVYAGPRDSVLDHAIAHPREISVQLAEEGVQQVVVADEDGRQQFLRLRSPLALPAVTELLQPQERGRAPGP